MSPTEEYAERFPQMEFIRWGKGVSGSQVGIGTYRMHIHDREHWQALHRALTNGINVIDTASTYSDGEAEELIGSVLAELKSEGYPREYFIIISKAGYVQGRNINRALKREHHGRAFPQMVKYEAELWHCIHPEFLQDQLDRTLRHIRSNYVDAYLLHNPEYFLFYASRDHIPPDEAREEFYHRIELAFRYLENEARAQRIRWYGVSSNCFGLTENHPHFISLERLISIAREVGGDSHHFHIVQAPLNLLEPGIAIEINNGNQTFLEHARQNGLAVMVNRALNAITGTTVVRLAVSDAAAKPQPSVSDVAAQLADVMRLEEEFSVSIIHELPFDTDSRELLIDYISCASTLAPVWERFESLEQWHEAESRHFYPPIREALQVIMHHPTPAAANWAERYSKSVEQLFNLLSRYYAHRALPRLKVLEQEVKEILGDVACNFDITELAFNIPRSTVGVTCTLLGARRPAYVDHLLTMVEQPLPPLDRSHWEALTHLNTLV